MSDKKQETSADIIAEMKRRKEMLEDAAFNAPLCYSTETMRAQYEILDEFVERLEAAHKREVDALEQRCAELNAAISEEQRRKMATTENPSAAGDCAKLREALGKIRAELWNNTVIAGKRKFELYEIADTALAAPPRNCDRFASAEEAWDAYDEWVESCRAKDQTPAFNEFGWLFALAAEKEGGNK